MIVKRTLPCWIKFSENQVPLPSLQGLPLPTGIRRGVEGRGGLLASIVFTEKLSPHLPVYWGVWVGGMCPFPESQGRGFRVPKLSALHYILSSGTSLLRVADALRCWRKGQEKKDSSERRNARKATWISFTWRGKTVCFFCLLGDGDISWTVLFKDLNWNLVHSLLVFHLSSLTWKLFSFFLF